MGGIWVGTERKATILGVGILLTLAHLGWKGQSKLSNASLEKSKWARELQKWMQPMNTLLPNMEVHGSTVGRRLSVPARGLLPLK